ncbi:MAG: hypothetical protein Q8P07_02680 [bacterium]|nr:hypothetical protein [bacterium]
MKIKKKGFILIYTVLLVSIVLVIVILNFSQSLSEIYSARTAEESVKAFYASATGLECVRFWHTFYQAFDTSKSPANYGCGIGANFSAGLSTPVCQDHTYPVIKLTGFANGACAEVSVKTKAHTAVVDGVPVTYCTLSVISTGKNSCSAVGTKKVERILLEEM